MEEKKIFVPHELKTIEIDVEKKIFRVNGEDFGRRCTGFSIDCSVDRDKKEFFKVGASIKATIEFANYDRNGNKTSEGERHLPETDAACD